MLNRLRERASIPTRDTHRQPRTLNVTTTQLTVTLALDAEVVSEENWR